MPGPWSAADIRYQAEQIATQKLHNGGHNCVSCQTLIMPEGWDQAQDLLDGFRSVVASAGERGVYYPGAGGARVEDSVVITDTGCRPLTRSPKFTL